jgi:hypothetical protein
LSPISASANSWSRNSPVLQAGISEGALRVDLDPWDVARGFLAYQQGVFHLWLSDPDAFSLRERATPLAELFISGIRAL